MLTQKQNYNLVLSNFLSIFILYFSDYGGERDIIIYKLQQNERRQGPIEARQLFVRSSLENKEIKYEKRNER